MQISIILYSEIDATLFRLEAEYYQPIYLDIEYKFTKNPSLLEFSNRIICGPFGSTILDETYTNNGVKVIRPFNIKNYQIEKENIVYISNEDVERKQLKIFSKRTIFFSRVGDIKCGIFTGDEKVTISPNIIAVDIKQEKYNPYFLTLFFNSKYGYLQILRELKISAQPTVSTERLQKLKLPLVSITFQNYIGDLFEKANEWMILSEDLFTQAQTLLLSELGLTNWQPKNQLTFIKNYSDTVQAGRIDAEYYQPKYEEIINAIKNYSGGWDMLGNLCITKRGSLISDNYYSDSDGVLYIRGADFSGGTLSFEKGVYISNGFKHKNEIKVKTGEIIFSLIGSVGETALVTDEFGGSYISNNTGKITCNEKIINPIVLQVLLKSIVGKIFFGKYKTQTAQPKISDKDIHSFVLPLFPESKQLEIQQKVTESFNLRKQSKHLLECAKKAVEMAIEQDEQTAIKWLENEVNEIQI